MTSVILLAASAVVFPRHEIDLAAYDAFMRRAFCEVHRKLAVDLAPSLPSGARILEIAFGVPYLSMELAAVTECSLDVVVEGSREALLTIRRLDEAGLSDRIRFTMADTKALPFADGTFDLVLARDSMRFWHTEPAAFSEINRVLKHAGIAALGAGLHRIMTPDEADSFWEDVQDWRNTTDHRPWAATLPFPEMITAAMDSAGIRGFRVWNEGYCTCRTSLRWRKGIDESQRESPVHVYDRAPPIGADAPDFVLSDTSGDSVTLTEYEGRVVVLDFWAVGCRSCLWLMRRLSPTHRLLEKQGVEFLAINLDSPSEKARLAASKSGLDIRVLYDGRDTAMRYGVRGLPHVVIVDGMGRIRARFLGGTEDVAIRIENTVRTLISSQDLHLRTPG